MFQKLSLTSVAMICAMFMLPIPTRGQTYDIPWFRIAGGGGYTAGDSFVVDSTIGQEAAGSELRGGQYSVASGFWPSNFVEDEITLTPTSLLVTRGTLVSGGVFELSLSDNEDLTIQRSLSDIQARTEFEVKTFSPVDTPSSLSITVEGAVFSRFPISQTIDLYDYDRGRWETVDDRNANRFTDATVTVDATGDLSRFVEPGSRSLEARIRFVSATPRQRFSSNTDLVSWTVRQ